MIRYAHANNSLQFTTNAAERMRIDSTGHIGIGTTSPTTFNANADDLVINKSGNAGITISTPNDAVGRIAFGDPEDNNIGEVRYHHSDNHLEFNVNAGEKLRIASSGQVGIGGANYGDSGQVLTSGGGSSAPSWTTISAAPQVTAVASGTLPNGCPIIVNSNGTVSKPTESDPTFSSPASLTTNSFSHTGACYNTTDNVVAVVYRNGSSEGRIAFGTISSGSITWNTDRLLVMLEES